MREINCSDIRKAIAEAVLIANRELPTDILDSLCEARDKEEAEWGQRCLGIILENAALASRERLPICQDTGMAVVDLEIGQDVHIVGGSLLEAVNEGVREGYREGYFRASIVADPLRRENTGDNTPAIVHTHLVPGSGFRATVFPKGGGSENMGRVAMLKPAQGWKGILDFVVESVISAGSNPCPPLVIGVGVGGTMELAAYLSKRALFRPLTQGHPSPEWAAREKELLAAVNDTGVGPQGFGGRVTALGVNIETAPTHIACLPVAVTLGCHATRRYSFEL